MNRRRPADPATEFDLQDDDEQAYRPRRTWFQRIVLAVGIVAVIGCIAAALGIFYESSRLDAIARRDLALTASSEIEPQNWLIVGSDSREVIEHNDPNAAVFTGGNENTGGQRSDTIMIVRIDPGGEHLDVLSLQRDLWLPIAGTDGSERINTAYTYPDGPQRLIDTIKLNFNIDINHYVEINFASFEGIVDAVGGLPMYFDKPMHDPNSGLQIDRAGCVTLDGFQALAFARSRHLQYSDGLHWVNDESADLGRISRQQYFMRKMFDRTASQVSNPLVLDKLIGIAKNNVGLDQELDITKAIAMGQRFGQFQGDSIKSYSLPVTPVTKPSGAQVLEVDAAGAKPILATFRGVSVDDVDPATVSFVVENGSGTPGQAAEVQKAFLALGYDVTGAKDHGSGVDVTEVRHAPGGERVADQIARHLTNGAVLVPDTSLAPGRFVVVTGRDFTTVMRRPREVTTGTEAPGASSTTTVANGKAAPSSSTTVAPAAPTHNDGTAVVGVVPGQPPEGTVCT